jgi:zinc transport system substrate-binding protein
MRTLVLLTALTAPLAAPIAAIADVPKVVTDISAIGSLTAQVMGDLGTPEILVAPGANSHNYQLRPSQARALQDANLLIWVGPEMTPWLVPAATDMADEAHVLGLLGSEGTYRRAFEDHDAHERGDEHDDDHDDHDDEEHHAEDHADHAHGDADAHDDHASHDAHDHESEEDHHHEGTDPHAWLDPDNAMIWLDLIASELSEIDPEHADTYRANAAKSHAEIEALSAELETTIAPVKDRPFVVSHDAYGYLQEQFGLQIIGSILLGDSSASGANHPRELLAEMKEQGAVCIFPETQLDEKPARLMAEGSGVRVGRAIDPSGNSHEAGPDLYANMMRGIIGALHDCLAE